MSLIPVLVQELLELFFGGPGWNRVKHDIESMAHLNKKEIQNNCFELPKLKMDTSGRIGIWSSIYTLFQNKKLWWCGGPLSDNF